MTAVYVAIYVLGFFLLDAGILLVVRRWSNNPELRFLGDENAIRLFYILLWPLTIPLIIGGITIWYTAKLIGAFYGKTLKRLEDHIR